MLGESEKDCEACKRLRRGLTWFGDEPPKCPKHMKHPPTYIDV